MDGTGVLAAAFVFGVLFTFGEGEECPEHQFRNAIFSFVNCAKESEKVNLNKKAEDVEEGCRQDFELINRCEETLLTHPLQDCMSAADKEVATLTKAMILSQNRFLCDEDKKLIKEFWNTDGIPCKLNTSQLLEKNDCFDHVPSFFDDYHDPKTCQKQLDYLGCIKQSLPKACSDFTLRVIYTYLKKSLLATPCKQTLIDNDETSLDIIVTTTEPSTTTSVVEPPSNSQSAIGLSWSSTILTALLVIYFSPI